MSLEDLENDLENWEPKIPEVDVESLKKHAFPYREDLKAKERRAICVPAPTRRFECPSCGILKNVAPFYSGEEWHYLGQCSNCGTSWVSAYHLMRRCEDCGTKVAVTSRNPEGLCRCQGETRGTY